MGCCQSLTDLQQSDKGRPLPPEPEEPKREDSVMSASGDGEELRGLMMHPTELDSKEIILVSTDDGRRVEITKMRSPGEIKLSRDGIIEYQNKSPSTLRIPDISLIPRSVCEMKKGQSFSMTICNRGRKDVSIIGGPGIFIVRNIIVPGASNRILLFVAWPRSRAKDGEEAFQHSQETEKVDEDEKEKDNMNLRVYCF